MTRSEYAFDSRLASVKTDSEWVKIWARDENAIVRQVTEIAHAVVHVLDLRHVNLDGFVTSAALG